MSEIHSTGRSRTCAPVRRARPRRPIHLQDYIVVCNFYPFSATISKPGCVLAGAVEEIDIGSVALLRAAAKIHEQVCMSSDPADYDAFLNAWKNSDASQALRNRLALKAFEMTAKNDDAINGHFREQYVSSPGINPLLTAPIKNLRKRS